MRRPTLVQRRRAADAAFVAARNREIAWRFGTARVRAWSLRHREALIVGGGFAVGISTSLLPLAALMRVASAFAGTASLMLEGPFLRLLAAQHRPAQAPPSAPPP
jgi:hypothetical protein